MWNEYLRSRSHSSNIPWVWIGALVAIIAIIVIARSFSSTGSDIDSTRAHLMVTPETASSTVFIAMTESSKNRITWSGWQALYVWDKGLSVETWWARAINNSLSLDIDEKSEISYIESSSSGEIVSITKWRMWVEQTGINSTIKMKNLSVELASWDIAIVEQNNQIYSTVYALKWDLQIVTENMNYVLKSGNRIMISASDLANPGLDLNSLVWSIDESITLTPLFIRNNGKDILKSANPDTNSGNTLSGSSTQSGITDSIISILEPLDGSISNKPTVTIQGTIHSTDIKKITFNEQDAIVSPVEWTFTFKDFPITAEVNNIVYKAYGTDGRLIQKGVITIFGSKQALQWVNKLISNSSPLSSTDFPIKSPEWNPFVTTNKNITVQGNVPKDLVSYITINDYRLQKFVAWSTSWYYYANMSTDTLREWINLYTIKFFWKDNELLYTQLFTIIKESQNATLSGEASR